MASFPKLIINTLFLLLILICTAFTIFLIVNWNFISNPALVPGYVESQATFAYGRDDLAKFRNWAFNYPMAILPYLIYIQSILLVHLIIKKNLLLNKLQWVALFVFLLFMIFSDYIFDNLSEIFNSNYYRQTGYDINDILGVLFNIAFLFVLISSLILIFIPRFKNYRKLFTLNIITIVVFVIFIFSFIEFFFD
ncbi:hypothetical protein [Marixanthomonas ophiurae]|uniref:Uncharacterized protein n=1 Tax=Marixanthomonas ophiurae TaxID=387659 RepID=A0A3E1QBR1_9FLAO|nr:hypothetical protein [Marixanthomonas ophiurae]RFN59575.1 hypothetical protein DZ858_05810 [Marixanthomonas ophiurae]